MKPRTAIIAVAVIVIVLLGGVVIRQKSHLSAERALSAELQKQAKSDETQIAPLNATKKTLAETPENLYHDGLEWKGLGNLDKANEEFESIVKKFPQSNLAGNARQQLMDINGTIAAAEAAQMTEAQKHQEEQEKLTNPEGKLIDYDLFYAKVKSNGLPIFKRFWFRANISHQSTLCQLNPNALPCDDALFQTDVAFDDETIYEGFLQNPSIWQTRIIVASMGLGREVLIHRIE